jgi:hypothetical protein
MPFSFDTNCFPKSTLVSCDEWENFDALLRFAAAVIALSDAGA